MDVKASTKLSVIIPIFNEEKCILKLLDFLDANAKRSEFIFVDGGSTDNTLSLLKNHLWDDFKSNPQIHLWDDFKNGDKIHLWDDFKTHSVQVIEGEKGRALQMNLGAKMAHCENLFFLHADSIPPKNFENLILECLENNKWGAFGIRFKTKNPLMKICSLISDTRVLNRKVAFGDQGIFIRREFFNELGGFPEIPIMEDYQFSLNAKKRGVYPKLLSSKIYTSARRFKSGGPLRTMWRMNRLRALYRQGVDIETIALLYKDVR